MGFGDPYHKHPLIEIRSPDHYDGLANCSYCELPITDTYSYGCTRCDYYIHKLCADLPLVLKHTLHEHPLTLSTTSCATAEFCDKCRKIFLDGFVYRCSTCRVTFHLNCLFTLKHEKHEHPLVFSYLGTDLDGIQVSYDCKVCGYPVVRFCFACTNCEFYIHHECSLIPSMIKHWHVHELTIRYNFPEECNRVYCDQCEDMDGKEFDRTLSYYYCKECDYISHLYCCLPEPKDDGVLIQHYTHEHLLRLLRISPKAITENGLKLHCDRCDYVVDEFIYEYPFLIKHPLHPQHALAFVREYLLFKCTECEFTIDCFSGLEFTHPYYGNCRFCTRYNQFRCNACGELGKGSRMMKGKLPFLKIDRTGGRGSFFNYLYYYPTSTNIDFHLECFALPGKFQHGSHPHVYHPLYLSSNPMKILSRDDKSATATKCTVCDEEIDTELCIYRCLECDYVAHLKCGASDLLSILRSYIKNEPNFCAIIGPDLASFGLQIEQTSSSYSWPPEPLLTDREIEEIEHVVRCPRCSLLISTQAKYQ